MQAAGKSVRPSPAVVIPAHAALLSGSTWIELPLIVIA
jgi:hypothetical protein